MDKKTTRLRRAKRTRAKIEQLATHRLCVHRTLRHIYAQIIAPSGTETLACASTLDAAIKGKVKNSGNAEAAKLVGQNIAELSLKLGIDRVAFDRSGFKYHGRVKALADSARESGLKF
ncbi:MAG: 50S ribosomal protein L18 [Gammaproteobacteria bacterium]